MSPGALDQHNGNLGTSSSIAFTYSAGEVSAGAGNFGTSDAEPDLDAQFITALGDGATTWQFNVDSSGWMLTFANDVLAMPLSIRPQVFSLSYGFPELSQCELVDCTNAVPNYTAYIQAAEVGFQKLALLGTSVIVASGDDGATTQGIVRFGRCVRLKSSSPVEQTPSVRAEPQSVFLRIPDLHRIPNPTHKPKSTPYPFLHSDPYPNPVPITIIANQTLMRTLTRTMNRCVGVLRLLSIWVE